MKIKTNIETQILPIANKKTRFFFHKYRIVRPVLWLISKILNTKINVNITINMEGI